MMSHPYIDGITGTVTRSFASSLTAGQITVAEDTVSISVVCPDRWLPGDVTVVTSRDGRAFAGQVEGMDACTGEITIRAPGSWACEALPDGVTLAGHHFFGPYREQDCQWDSPLDIRAIIDSIDLEPIIKAHQAGGGDQQSAQDGARHWPAPLYLAGAPLLEVFPVLAIAGNMALGAAVMSHACQLNLTAVADRDRCPDARVFAGGMRRVLDELARQLA